MGAPRKALFIALILLATILPFSLAIGDPGWLAGWDYRVKITIDSGDVDEVLSDFPILIYLSDSSGINGENISFIFDEVGANALRIAVTLDDGETECYVEVEKWDLGNRDAWLWAKIASINNITDTDLYLYYDNDHADNTDKVGPTNSAPAESVWDENFILVWHMRDIDTSSVRDSTDNDKDGTKEGPDEPLLTTAGKIGEAQDFDGGLGDDFISNIVLGNLPDGFTVEIWFKTSYEGDNQGLIVQRGNAVSNHEMLWVRVEPSNNWIRTLYYVLGEGSTQQTTASDYVDGYFHRFFWAVANNRNNIWVDDFEEIDVNTDEYAGINFDVDGYVGKMRNSATVGYDFFDGPLDEVRISNMDRSEAWGQASYQSEIDDLLDFGEEEEPSPENAIENKGIVASDSTVDDEQWFFLNASIEILPDSSTFLFNRIDIDPDGLNMSCSYTNSTDTFVEENDPNNYLQLDVVVSVKMDLNNTFVRVDYYLRIHSNVTKDGAYNVTVYSTASGDLSDSDNYTSVFTLTIRTPSAPTLLFGAGFNASSPYVELHWYHNLLIYDLFEVQNSSNNVDWGYLGQNTTREYTDSQVVNGTERYYKVRTCRETGVGWKNSSFTDSNFETVYFVEAAEAAGDTYVTGSVGIFLIVLIIIIPIVFYAVRKR